MSGNSAEGMVTEVSRWNEWRAEEVCVGAIGDGGMSGRRRWWTGGVALVRLWDSARRSTRDKWKKVRR
jgi:hypothetical protein